MNSSPVNLKSCKWNSCLVVANSANESESYAAHPVSVTFGQLADPNSLASEQLTTIESEPANDEAACFEKIEVDNEKVEKEEKLEIKKEEELEIQEENKKIENEEKDEPEKVEENSQEGENEKLESTTIANDERMMKQEVEKQKPVLNPDPATWEQVVELSFMQEDSESDECEHENLVKGIHELSFQLSEQLDEEGNVPEKCETATDLPANTEYNYNTTIKSPIVNPKCTQKNQVQKVTKVESEEKQVHNEKSAQKAKSPVKIAPKSGKKENQDKTVVQSQSEKKYDVTRPCRTLTVSPVGISAALKVKFCAKNNEYGPYYMAVPRQLFKFFFRNKSLQNDDRLFRRQIRVELVPVRVQKFQLRLPRLQKHSPGRPWPRRGRNRLNRARNRAQAKNKTGQTGMSPKRRFSLM